MTLTATFQADVRALAEERRAQVLDVMLALPVVFRAPHLHSGIGLRKIHAKGIWEARVGLDLRLVVQLAKDEIVLVRVADHDQVRRYLRSL